ncbi:MAG: Glutamate-tRNA ligase [candidate division WWE3 bacterium GW2011_GWA1_41_8]|uniref:Glutamate--tRNA ligase n=1 Tax=candidate division WWE3 bacterium GW2011_GWA1_41_8 TaxID=1619103 RepID=A0A0G1A903_UNCKA|nr:MAG: Glutamate-tRNA ligase [candidate division WWE3 bacterium GW2011_GWA1_41_8]
MEVRTRIAPSPTGELHIGHLRTLLYDYAYAKKNNGKFIVRVEDTDRTRFVEGSMDRTLDVIIDYGIMWDEGPRIGGPHEPYEQSKRLGIYKKHAEELVAKGHGYYCFCTPERLEKMREEQRASGAPKTVYDRHCRNLPPEEVEKNLANKVRHVVRLKVPADETVVLNDLVHGEVVFDTNEIDDAVLLKSDGYPTYHLAAMVDDHLMEITHVLRGIDWMPSSPVHMLIYKSFGWELPVFVHLPNLKEMGSNQKLSKRFGAVAAVDFLQDGFLAEAVLNFLMFLGWNPGTEKEIYSLEEFTNDFSLEKLQKTDLVAFDREKLTWYNGYYMDFADITAYFFDKPKVDREMLIKQSGDEGRMTGIITSFNELLTTVSYDDWRKDNLDRICHAHLTANNYKPKEAFMNLRIALSGETATPPIFDTMEVLGRNEVLERLRAQIR